MLITDVHARYFGTELNDQSLTPGDNPHRQDAFRGPAQATSIKTLEFGGQHTGVVSYGQEPNGGVL
jgi:hypothetical protein